MIKTNTWIWSVVVNFYNHNDINAPPQEVRLQESNNLPVDYTYDDHGELTWTVCLSHILPKAIKNNSPIKCKSSLWISMQELINFPPLEHGGRIYHHGITSTAGCFPLGAVNTIISDEHLSTTLNVNFPMNSGRTLRLELQLYPVYLRLWSSLLWIYVQNLTVIWLFCVPITLLYIYLSYATTFSEIERVLLYIGPINTGGCHWKSLPFSCRM